MNYIDIAGITQIISNVGFPIACCIALFVFMTKQSETHREEMNGVKTALENNTLAITKLSERIGKDT